MQLRYAALGVAALIVAAGGFAVTKMITRPRGVGECSDSAGDARRTCYSRLLSERLTRRGVAKILWL